MKTVVIVDDSHSISSVIKAYIRAADNASYDVVMFDNVVDAGAFIVDNEVSLLFQDVQVKDTNDGLMVANIAKGIGIPVVLLTSDSSIRTIRTIAKNDYAKCIIKPVTQSEVESALFTLA